MGSRSFHLGKRIGDFFTDRYFELPLERQVRWDRSRVLHHGAVGYLLAAGSARALAHRKGRIAQTVLGATFGLGLGLAESDLHDRDRWWTEGRLFEPRPPRTGPPRRWRFLRRHAPAPSPHGDA